MEQRTSFCRFRTAMCRFYFFRTLAAPTLIGMNTEEAQAEIARLNLRVSELEMALDYERSKAMVNG